jgi:peptidyl-dipeptidase A
MLQGGVFMNRIPRCIALILSSFTLSVTIAHAQSSSVPPPTPEQAQKFIDDAEQRWFDLNVKASRASWVQENFITADTEQIAADANEVANTAATEYAKQAHRFDNLQLSPELSRKRLLLELAAGFPAPNDPKAQKELAQILSSLDGDYGKGKWCPDGASKPCLDVTAIEKLMATSRDPEEL